MSSQGQSGFAGERHVAPAGHVAPGLGELVTAVRAAVGRHADWRATARLVTGELRRHLPSSDILTAEQRIGTPAGYRSHALHAKADGTFSIVALVWRPGQRPALLRPPRAAGKIGCLSVDGLLGRVLGREAEMREDLGSDEGGDLLDQRPLER
jgi:hypothetical protein